MYVTGSFFFLVTIQDDGSSSKCLKYICSLFLSLCRIKSISHTLDCTQRKREREKRKENVTSLCSKGRTFEKEKKKITLNEQDKRAHLQLHRFIFFGDISYRLYIAFLLFFSLFSCALNTAKRCSNSHMLAHARPTAYSLYSKLAFLFLSLCIRRMTDKGHWPRQEGERIYSRDAICCLAEEEKRKRMNDIDQAGF